MNRMRGTCTVLAFLLFCGLGGRDAFAQAGPRAERFVQFADFLHDIAAADLAGYSALPETRVRTSEAFEEMRRHLLSLYEAVTAEGVHSFVLDAQTFDCLPVEQQPSVRALGLPRVELPPPPLAAADPGEPAAGHERVASPLTLGLRDTFRN